MKEEKKEEPTPRPAAAAKLEGGKVSSTVPWPLRDIKDPHDHDVLYGRGGGTNHHIGNKRYRKMVEDKKVDYVNSKRLDKPLVALNIIRQWRDQDPPGRFLKLDEKTGLWHDVGDKKAREKTSQALREKAPELRKQQEVDKLRKEGKLGSDEEPEDSEAKRNEKEKKPRVKKTAFNVPEGEPKKRDSKNIKHLMLARDHSLGRDYLKPDERVDLDGFSWDEPVGELYGKKGGYGRQRLERLPFPPKQAGEGWGSGRFANIEPSTSMPPPPPGPYASRSAGSAGEFNSMMPAPETQVSREHSLANNPLPGAAVDGPARNPFPREGKAVSGGGLDESWVRAPAHPPSQPYGFPPPPRQTSQSRFLSNEGSSAFSRTPSTQGGDRSRMSPASAEDAQRRRRSSSGRIMEHEYNQGPYHGSGGSSRREWSNQSDGYRNISGSVEDDPYNIRRSWSGHSDEYSRGPSYPPPDTGAPHPPPDGRSHSGHDSWPSHARPYSAALREEGPPVYAPHPPPPPQPHDARHLAPPPPLPPHDSYRFPPRRESSDRMLVEEHRSHATDEKASFAGSKEKAGSGKSVVKPSLRRKLSGGGVTPRSPQTVESKKGLTRPQPVKRDTSHQCENDETKSKVKRSFVSSKHSLESKDAVPDTTQKLAGAIFEEEDRMKELETTFEKSHLDNSVVPSIPSTKPSTVSAKSRLSTADAIGMAFSDDVAQEDFDRSAQMNAKPSSVSAKSRLTTVDAIGMAFADDQPEDAITIKPSGKAEKSSTFVEAKPETRDSKNRLSSEGSIATAFAKPQSLSENQRLTSLGDPLDGDDLLIDPVTTHEVLGVGVVSESRTTAKPDNLSAKQRVTTVDALLMEIEDEVDALRRPDALNEGQRKDTITAITDGLSEDAIAKAWLDS